MNNSTVSMLLGLNAPTWAPSDEGAGGGSGETDGETGGETTGEAGQSPSDGTVLGSDQAGEKPGEGAQDGEAPKDEGDNPNDDKKSEDGDGDKDGDTATDGADEVPEDGVYDFELPDEVGVSDEAKQAWSEQFKEIGLTRAQAAKLVETQTAQVQSEQKAFADFLENQQTEHLAAGKADKDIGGDKWAESTRLANIALQSFQGTAIKDLILSSGNGNNPEMIRELRRIGEMVKDDTFEDGASHEEPATKETSWYGSTTPSSKKG